jgi:hypothetical protein
MSIEFGVPVKKVIVNLEDAQFYQDKLNSVFEVTKDGMTRKQKDAFQQKLNYLAERIQIAEDHGSYSYHQETLEELHDDGE